MVSGVKQVISDPKGAWLKALLRFDKERLYARYHQLSHGQGLRALYLILSFDCDTPDDIEAAPEVFRKLKEMGVHTVFAVPGQLLEEGREVYTQIFQQGAEFMNHGYIRHTYFDEGLGRHASCFFYEEQSRERLKQDIHEGHEAVGRVLGKSPMGFRTPHFGTFQKPDELSFLYGELRSLGYRYSSSTVPIQGFKNGPLSVQEGIFELPVSGMWSNPFSILDSWAFFAAPDRKLGPTDFKNENQSLMAHFRKPERFGILNIYADPSHVLQHPEFFDCIHAWTQIARSVTYQELFEELHFAS